MEILLNDMIGEDNEAVTICRGAVEEGYIIDTFCEEDIQGYIAKIEGQYAGFILFKKVKGYYYLSLVGTKPKLGMPLGQILIALMEQIAIQDGIGIIKADAIGEALNFYKKHNWTVIEADEEEDSYFIQKQVIKGYVEIIGDSSDDEEDYDSDIEEFEDIDFEEYANRELEVINIHYGKSIVDRMYEYVYSYF